MQGGNFNKCIIVCPTEPMRNSKTNGRMGILLISLKPSSNANEHHTAALLKNCVNYTSTVWAAVFGTLRQWSAAVCQLRCCFLLTVCSVNTINLLFSSLEEIEQKSLLLWHQQWTSGLWWPWGLRSFVYIQLYFALCAISSSSLKITRILEVLLSYDLNHFSMVIYFYGYSVFCLFFSFIYKTYISCISNLKRKFPKLV